MRTLIVRFSAIGDCILAAHLATALRLHAPEDVLGWVVDERCEEVIDTQRLMNRRIALPWATWKRRRWSPSTWRAQLRVYLGLREHAFDLGLDLQGHSKTALCLRLARPRRRLAARATDAFARRLNPVLKTPPRGPHELDLYAAVLAEVRGLEIADRPMLPELEEEKEAVSRELGPEPFVTIQTGAGFADKRYPAELWAEVVRRLRERGLRVVAIGGAGDPRIPHPEVVDRVGAWNLRTSLAAVALSRAHFAADTGTAHAAAAFRTPVVTIFGRTDPARFRPWTPFGRVLRASNDPADVPPDQVVQAASELMEAHESAIPR